MARRSRTRPLSLVVVGLLFVCLLLGLSFVSLHRFEGARALADHTAQVRLELAHSLRLLADAETGQRGFLLTADPAYLEPYELAGRQLPGALQRTAALLADDPAQRARLAELQALANDKLAELGRTIAVQRAGAPDRALALVASGQGKRTMDAFRDLHATMMSVEEATLAERVASTSRLGRLSFVGIAATSAALVLVGFLLLSVRRELEDRAIADLRIADLEHFAGRVAHDIRSPLASVNLAVDLARRRPEDPKAQTALERASKTLQRVGTLIEGLLVFATAGTPPSDAAGAEADVQEVARDVVEGARPAARERGIDLNMEDLPVAAVACSPGVLMSMISNLVENAIKYIGCGPVKEVRVRARTQGLMTRVEVADTGPGVPQGLASKVFDPYVRAPGLKQPGIGLGLATVRRLAESHGGSVGVTKNGATGSVFWFELPRAEHP